MKHSKSATVAAIVPAHPWDAAIADYAVVSSSGTKVDRFASEESAREFAAKDDSSGNYIHAVYGPGLRNRVAVCMCGSWYSPEEFDAARGFRSGASFDEDA